MSVFVSLFLLILSCEVKHIDDSICKIIVFVLIFIICLITPLLIVNKSSTSKADRHDITGILLKVA
jgi:amino acid permease